MAQVQNTPFTFQTLSWMLHLKALQISNGHTVHPMNTESDDSPPCLSSNLSLLLWHCYPFKSLRSSDFLVQNLVELIMPGSNITELWNGNQYPKNLNILNLNGSFHLVRLPDFSSATKLEEIDLSFCKSLQDLPPSTGNLKNLKTLDVSFCYSLTRLPSFNSLKICEMNGNMSPAVLIASFCRNLREVPDNIMGSFTTITLNGTAIQQLPPLTVADFSSSLKCLSMKYCEDLTSIPGSICELKYLCKLDLHGCLNLSKLPPLNGLSSLKSLSLEGSGIVEIPTDIVSLVSLESLDVKNCKRLRSLPLLPWQLKRLNAQDCVSLQAASVTSRAFAYFSTPVEFHKTYGDFEFNFSNCIKLDNNARTKIMADARWRIEETTLLRTMKERFNIRLPGSEIPEWFSHQTKGTSMKIQLPHFSYPIMGAAFCVVIEFKCASIYAFPVTFSYGCRCSFRYDSGDESIASTSSLSGVHDQSDHVLLWYSNYSDDMILRNFSGKHVLLQFNVENSEKVKQYNNIEIQVKRCGVFWVLHK